ncbi:hypothetical protein [Xanthobacter sp. 91]|uniref:hypothetical protein n=1 Tax=Xanthobacter sp. 91 TaxID=1117244 RepID=UPI0012DDA4E5|nr:hypothetical protein [Xanthobacter sp. 91]
MRLVVSQRSGIKTAATIGATEAEQIKLDADPHNRGADLHQRRSGVELSPMGPAFS